MAFNPAKFIEEAVSEVRGKMRSSSAVVLVALFLFGCCGPSGIREYACEDGTTVSDPSLCPIPALSPTPQPSATPTPHPNASIYEGECGVPLVTVSGPNSECTKLDENTISCHYETEPGNGWLGAAANQITYEIVAETDVIGLSYALQCTGNNRTARISGGVIRVESDENGTEYTRFGSDSGAYDFRIFGDMRIYDGGWSAEKFNASPVYVSIFKRGQRAVFTMVADTRVLPIELQCDLNLTSWCPSTTINTQELHLRLTRG